MITKARVASLKVMAIPRMQLVAATPSILVKNELEIPVNNNVFRTDTEVALNQKSSGYSWKTNLKLSRIIQMNSSGIMSVQNRTKWIMHQNGLLFVMMKKLKGDFFDYSFFGNQTRVGMKTE